MEAKQEADFPPHSLEAGSSSLLLTQGGGDWLRGQLFSVWQKQVSLNSLPGQCQQGPAMS